MNVDIQTLGTFNQLAQEGAQRAAASLEQLTGVPRSVEATTIDLATRADVIAELQRRDLVGVEIEFSNALRGQAILVFDRAGARTLAENLPGGEPSSDESVRARIEEVANILVSGFIDGWADHLDATIDISDPSTVSDPGGDVVPGATPVPERSEQVLSFRSVLTTMDASVDASVYIFPERESFETIVADQLEDGSAPIPLEKLQTFNRMASRGADRASENLTTMTGIETTVEVSRLRFLPVEQTVSQFDDELAVGVVVGLDGLPSGYFLILFDEASAVALADRLGAGPVDDEFGAVHRSAIEEIGNVMSSGFIDGWANVLGTSIAHTPPEFLHTYAGAMMDSVATRLATEQQYAFVFDSFIETREAAVTCEIFALPNEAELERALRELELDAETAADDEALVAEMDADPEDVF